MRMPIAAWRGAHPSNYSVGRAGRAIKYVTVHHTAANNSSLASLYANPARQGSAHFFVSDRVIEQYVDTNDTAWTNGNLVSNRESITIEVNGDWRNGYYNQGALDNLERLFRALLAYWPDAGLTYHKDVSDKPTACPADLKDKGYALQTWNKAKGGGVSKPTTNTLRIIHSEVGGWDFEKTHKGEYDQLFKNAAGHLEVNEFVHAQWVSGSKWRTRRAQAFDDAERLRQVVKDKDKEIARLSALAGEAGKWETLRTLLRELLGIK